MLSILAVLSAIALYNVRAGDTSAYVATMKSDLRYLALAQEEHYSEFDRYAAAVGDLDYHASPGVTIELATASEGWSARASHARRSADRTFCAIYHGTVVPPFPATREGVPDCIAP